MRKIRVNVLLPGGITNTDMVPAGTPENVRAGMLQPEIMKDPAVFLASDESQDITGHRLIASKWSTENPRGSAILGEIE